MTMVKRAFNSTDVANVMALFVMPSVLISMIVYYYHQFF